MSSEPPTLEFRLLGPLEVLENGRRLPLRRRRHRALLAALLLRVGETVSIDRLVDDLWGEQPPPTARAALHNAVSAVRKLLAPDTIVSRPHGYLLDVDPERVDLRRFERLVASAENAAPRERAEHLREAIALWRGPALDDLAYETFVQAHAERLEEVRTTARLDLVDAELALGRDEALLPTIEELVAEHPFRERPRGQLMLALYRAGRQGDALAAYQEARSFLDEELGLEPSPPLQDLQQRILRQDPSLRPAAPPLETARTHGRRKTITVVFADVVDSTSLAAALDPEALRSVLARYFREARTVLERHGGTVEKFIGDAVVAVFGVQSSHEDDALRAVRAALELRDAVARLDDELLARHARSLRLRIGVNTGVALVGESAEGGFATGYAVNVAAKLQQSAAPGEILLASATHRLVAGAVRAEPLAPLELGGPAAPIPLFRLDELVPGAPAVARHLEAPLVGRTEELDALRQAFADVLTTRRCRVFTVAGDAGIGKSRLVHEFAALAREEATVAVGHCVSYGDGATYLPLAEIVRALAPAAAESELLSLLGDDADAALVARRIRELIGAADGPAPSGEAFWAVRRLFAAAAGRRPLVVVLEDVHWAEATLLDLVEHIAAHVEGVPLLIVCLTRPELRESRTDWRIDLPLSPLGADQTAELVSNLPGGSDVPDPVRARIVDVAEGNALFAEQLLVHAAEAAGEVVRMPPTLDALLAERLDRLPTEEREALECASVLGRDFDAAAVAELADRSVGPALSGLAARGLVRPSARTDPTAGETLTFHHVLIRDAAYSTITKKRRADLHEHAAELLDARGLAPDELVGYHLEQAYRCRVDVGAADRHALRLAEDAGTRLSAAGVRAWRTGDAAAAVNLIGRAADLLPDSHPLRAETLRELSSTLWAAGDVNQAETTLLAAVATAEAAGDRGAVLRAELDLAYLRLFAGAEGGDAALLDLAAQAIPVFEALRDERSLGWAWLAVAYVHGGIHGRYRASEEAAERGLAHYRRHGWVPQMALLKLAAALYYGPRPVPDAIRRCRALLRDADRGGEALVRTYLAGLEAMRGRFPVARELLEHARTTLDELGSTISLAITWAPVAGDVEALAGDVAGAARILRASCVELERVEEWSPLSTQAAQLADVLYRSGDEQEARRWAQIARSHTVEGDATANVGWRGVDARLLADAGAVQEAEALAREAVAISDTTDSPDCRAAARLALAQVVALAGDDAERGRLIDEASALLEEKGNSAALEAAQGIRERASA